ncbi:acyl-CoA dehydrogenase C-terminal domain-containing protein [Variovorax sp. J22R133]|uniref:acyl-CoA dehydrogenase C-terminal domain-containing protein n=1 Tax=Variovorax brevis TaxID=3053503 RepID=UPI0025761AD2|nr:acyl-CoA dehydrogenase C-terminal domain-containing protein [Variovorax sp. J22R133]MDM0111401.1 acyl-CoA dehydrogenase C-terminal domain-containing protein [Variovorax sp. J22R133]
MPSYDPPLAEFRFLLQEVLAYEDRVASLPGFADASMDLVMPVLESAGEFARDVLVPINNRGDDEGCIREGHTVRTPAGYVQAYQAYRDAGWPSLAGDPAYGGQGLPITLSTLVREMIGSGSMAFGMYGGLSQGAYRALLAHGTDALRAQLLPPLVDGRWTGTMCLTEADSGSDLSRLRTRATPAGDGTYRINGSKIFISGGDHDLAENILHLVLARLPDAPAGTRGISLFLVPKKLPRTDGTALPAHSDNHVTCTGVEHKMGIRASATAALAFDDSLGWLVGEPNGGLKAMFTMMNSSRIGVAVQSIGVAELSLQNGRHYALERRQGRAPGSGRTASEASDPIVQHPDVRKNLLTMKAITEGARALYTDAAIGLDIRSRHPDPRERARAENRLALLTPVLKAFLSDGAVEVTRLGITIFGGHGYIHENGMEQLLRDAQIVPLYEGTNAIQALDLVHRKLALEDGKVVADWLEETRALVRRHADKAPLAPLCTALGTATERLEEATGLMQQRSREDAVAAAASASDYLRMFGLVALGAAWLRMGVAALAARGGESPAFYAGKVKTACFYGKHLLVQTGSLLQSIQSDAGVLMSHSNEEL